MELRVYDSARGGKERHKFENYIDRYCLYFPYPKKWLIDSEVKGDYLAFSFNTETKIIKRCYWDEWKKRDGFCDKLGKKIHTDKLPDFVAEWVKGYEKVWNDYINNEDNEKFKKAFLEYN